MIRHIAATLLCLLICVMCFYGSVNAGETPVDIEDPSFVMTVRVTDSYSISLPDLGAAYDMAVSGLSDDMTQLVLGLIRALGDKNAELDSSTAPVLLKALEHEHGAVREIAAYGLGEIGDPAAVSALIDLLDDESGTVRRNAAEALGKIGKPAQRAVPELEKKLLDQDTEVSSKAALALARIDRSRREMAIAFLIQGLYSQNDAAIETLGQLGKPAVPALKKALKHENPDVEGWAAWALGRIGQDAEEAVPALIEVWKLGSSQNYRVCHNAVAALIKISEPAVPALTRVLNSKDEPDFPDWPYGRSRVVAAWALGQIHSSRSHIRACGMLYPNGFIEPSKETISALMDALSDDAPRVRVAAVESLGKMGEWAKDATPVLIKALDDEDASVRRLAVAALVGLGEYEVVMPILIQLLQDENDDTRREAVQQLGTIREPAAEAVPLLIPLLNDEDDGIRSNTAWALRRIGKPDKKATAMLVKLLNDKNQSVRVDAAYTLAEIGETDEGHVPALIVALDDEYWGVRCYIAQILGNMGKSAAPSVPFLIKILQQDESARESALEALKKIGTPEAMEAVAEYKRE